MSTTSDRSTTSTTSTASTTPSASATSATSAAPSASGASAAASFDAEAYVRRIGYGGPRTPTLETLRAIAGLHAQAIPFENLNPLLRRPVPLDIGALQEKIVHGGRGGYCFEQNLLLAQALRTIGFTVTGLAARVRWNVPDHVVTARGHMLLRIDLDERRAPEEALIVDVGFGGLTLTGVLRLEPDVEQATPHEPFRLARAGAGADEFLMQSRFGGAWRTLYRFGLQEQFQVDYEVTNWYLSTHPSSHFLHGLIAARPESDRRYALRNNEFAIHHRNGPTERRLLGTAAELRQTLAETFRITLPDWPELEATLTRIAATAVPA